jgi:opacity protein-like surface antigen
MVSVRLFITAAATSMLTTAAFAADMAVPPAPYQQPPMVYAPPPVVAPQPLGGWYLRGDVGVGMQSFSSFNFTQTNPNFVWPSSWSIVQKDLGDTTTFGGGVGYEFNNWFRVDVTAEYRDKAAFKTIGSYTNFCAGGGTCFDVTQGNLASTVVMANAYVDLGTWWCLTPYIGAGLGGAYNRTTGVTDNGINSDGTSGFGFTTSDASQWSLAWNAQAGVTYNVTNAFKVDLNVRYLRLGSPITSTVYCQNTPSCPGAYYSLTDTSSWDFRVGLRWLLQPDPVPVSPMPTLMSRG